MKLSHNTLRSTQTISSVGLITVDAAGFAEVSPEQAEHLVKCGFQRVEPLPPPPPEDAPPPPPPPPEEPPADSMSSTKDAFVAALDKASEPSEPKKKAKK